MRTENEQIVEQIKKAEHVLVTFNCAWDGDAVASSLALFSLLKKMNKQVDIVAQKPENNSAATDGEETAADKLYSFLPGFEAIRYDFAELRRFIISLRTIDAKVAQVKYQKETDRLDFIITPKTGVFSREDVSSAESEFRYDLIIVADTTDLESLGRIFGDHNDLFYQTPIINIDHHAANEDYGQINHINLTAVATAEIVYALVRDNFPDFLDADMATSLLAGMISKTRSFKTANVTPQALAAAAELIALGARREEIVNHFYRSRSINALKLWGRVLAKLQSAVDGKLVWSTLSHLDFTKTSSTENDLSEVIEELIVNIPQARVIIIIFEIFKDGASKTKALVHTIKNINALALTKELKPEGTKNIVRIVIDKPYQLAEIELIALIADKLKHIIV